MKLKKPVATGFLLVISFAGATAQSTLPNPSDNSCWSSLDACAPASSGPTTPPRIKRGSSYPEYQCAPAQQQQSLEKAAAKQDKNKGSQTTNPRRPGLKPLVPADAETQTANAK